MNPQRGHRALRRGRVSAPGATYFITTCTKPASRSLCDPAIFETLQAEIALARQQAAFDVKILILMPDHLHLVLTTGSTLTLSQVLGRLKARVNRCIRPRVVWQQTFFDRRLRPDDDRAALYRYIFLNPYRKYLCAIHEPWPYFWICDEESTWFSDLLDKDLPVPVWLQ